MLNENFIQNTNFHLFKPLEPFKEIEIKSNNTKSIAFDSDNIIPVKINNPSMSDIIEPYKIKEQNS